MKRLALAALVLSLLGCDASGWFKADRSRGSLALRDPNTLIVARPSDAIHLDPGRPTDNESVEVIDQIVETLVQYRAGSYEIDPALATEWSVSENGKVWTFRLREGVRFHDGTRLDAEAVVFSLERQRDAGHPYHRADFSYWENMYRIVEKVEALDEMTVAITIERPYAPFLANMAMFPVAIVSPAAVRGDPERFDLAPVGTGPFKFSEWEKGERIVLSRNEDYWGPAPAFSTIVFRVIRDARQRLIALESGAIDLVHGIPPEEMPFVALHPGISLHETAANNVAYLAMNTLRPPFDDVRVRRAIHHAINKLPITKLLYQGMAVPAEGPLPPTQWGFHQLNNPTDYDPAKSQALLAEVVAEGSFDSDRVYKLYAPSTPRPYLAHPEQVARALQANLAAVGVKVDVVFSPMREHSQAVQAGDHDLCLFGWVGDNGDPDNFLYVLFDRDNTVPGLARNVAFLRDAELHDLLIAAQTSSDRREREVLYGTAQERIHFLAPWAPLAHARAAVAARIDVDGLILNPSGHVSYRDARRLGH